MKNEFMIETKRAMYRLRNLQYCHVKMREKSDARLRVAQERHALEISRAEMVEAKGWNELMSITGMTIPTAAAILQVSESTVSRWIARHGKGVEATPSADTSAGGA
ncbi:MAG: helix-turn-helix domain containing protein [Candidatus Nanopelagicales bacterium]|nr:helix-turn-helix domain containing protein [Candidatus Nanopelagicales bacterium]MDD2819034.1 helix-turn-helix domain containing protein [Candidatus Nanopelagicales bacterium]